jgi:Zn-dependent metalloprotease
MKGFGYLGICDFQLHQQNLQWLIGEDIERRTHVSLRSMSDPNADNQT